MNISNQKSQMQIKEKIGKISDKLEELIRDKQEKENRSSSIMADQSSKMQGQLFQYIEQIKLDQKVDIEKAIAQY